MPSRQPPKGSQSSQSAELASQLRDEIVQAALRPGDKLPSERRLVAELRVARSSVREAFCTLENEGLIERQAGRAARCRNLLSEKFPQQMMAGISGLSLQLQVMDARAVLEGEAAFYAAKRASDQELLALALEHQQMSARSGGPQRDRSTLERAKADLKFHTLIAQSSHNLLVVSFAQLFYQRFFHVIYEVLDTTLKRSGRFPDGIRAQHRAIHDAIQTRDAERARREAREHILFTRKLLEESVGG